MLRIALVAALGSLPRRQRQAVALRYLGDLSDGEVAVALGISVGSVKTHIHRGLGALRSPPRSRHGRGGPRWPGIMTTSRPTVRATSCWATWCVAASASAAGAGSSPAWAAVSPCSWWSPASPPSPGTGGEPTTQLAAGGRATTTVAPVTGGTVFALDAPTTSVEVTPPTSRVPVATTVPDEPVTTLGAGRRPSPRRPIPAGPAQPRCGPAVMQATITMAPTFVAGQPVSGQAVLRNTSGAPCYYSSYTATHEINDSLGNPVVPGSALIADAFEDTPFAPGQTLTQPVQWSAGVAGSYVAKVSWSFDGPKVEATAAFTVA